MSYFYTSDEHMLHPNIIKYCSRPFSNVTEMTETIIENHNEVVKDGDITVHVGDFTLAGVEVAKSIIGRLNGDHVFVIGNHDKWLKNKAPHLWEKTIEGQHIVCSHYPMYSWPKSHYGSWLLYGHHHGRFSIQCKAIDVGVDTNNFYPYSFEQIKQLMDSKPETPGTIKSNY